MEKTKHHVIVLPYYCQDEVKRYVKIATLMKRFDKPTVSHSFLLAASPLAEQSDELMDAFSELAPTRQFKCPTQVFGYPEGPTAMYWDAMEFVAKQNPDSSGFSLWFESDMCPAKPDWLDRLSAEWYATEDTPMMMGCFVPEVYKYRFFREPKLILDPHINGGACYAIDFAANMPTEAREGVFDMAVYGYAKLAGLVRETQQIAFSSTNRVRRDLLDEKKVLLHGFMQDKDKFIDSCIRPITAEERKLASWSSWRDQVENLQRRVRVRFVRKGHRAMLENMLLAKEKFESSRQLQLPPKRRAA